MLHLESDSIMSPGVHYGNVGLLICFERRRFLITRRVGVQATPGFDIVRADTLCSGRMIRVPRPSFAHFGIADECLGVYLTV